MSGRSILQHHRSPPQSSATYAEILSLLLSSATLYQPYDDIGLCLQRTTWGTTSTMVTFRSVSLIDIRPCSSDLHLAAYSIPVWAHRLAAHTPGTFSTAWYFLTRCPRHSPTDDTADPHPLLPDNLLQNAIRQAQVPFNISDFVDNTCARCIATLEIAKILSLATPKRPRVLRLPLPTAQALQCRVCSFTHATMSISAPSMVSLVVQLSMYVLSHEYKNLVLHIASAT